MKKSLFNPYKLKRKVKRGVFSSQHGVGIDERLSLRPFDGEKRWSRNPYEPRPAQALKRKVEVGVFVVSLLTIFGLCFFHPYFSIRVYSVSGLHRMSESVLTQSIQHQLEGKKYFVLNKNNYFAIDVSKVRDNLLSEYSFQSIRIQKKFPHTLAVEAVEKTPVFLYDSGKEYTLVGEQGEKLEVIRAVGPDEWSVVSRMVSSTSSTAEGLAQQEIVSQTHRPNTANLVVAGVSYPILFDAREISQSREYIFPIHIVQGIKKWNEFLISKGMALSFIEMQGGGEEGYIHSTGGCDIAMKFADADIAFPVFLSLLPQIDKKTCQYVDMRYLSRVYWK